jgi:hypothetical protein
MQDANTPIHDIGSFGRRLPIAGTEEMPAEINRTDWEIPYRSLPVTIARELGWQLMTDICCDVSRYGGVLAEKSLAEAKIASPFACTLATSSRLNLTACCLTST